MKKLKIFGFLLMTMLIGFTQVNAIGFEFSTDLNDSSITYTLEDGESLSHQIVKITEEQYKAIENKVQDYSDNALDYISSELKEKIENLNKESEEAESNLNIAEAAYEANPTAENKAALDMAQKVYDGIIGKTFQILNEFFVEVFTDLSNIVAEVAPYSDENWEAYTEKTGEIGVDENTLEDGYVYVLWLNGTDMTTGTPQEFTMLAGVYDSRNGQIVNPEMPEVTTQPTVQVPTETPKKENIENPKTGVSMPVALGIGVVAVAGTVMFVVCKKQFFKQL